MKINKSLNYILPLIYYSLEEEFSFESTYFRKKVLPFLKNSYIKYNGREYFALLLSIECDKFFVDCQKSIIFAESIIDTDNSTTLVIFEIPKDHKESFELFKNGKYSQICKKDKQLILSFTNDYVSKKYDVISKVLFKDKSLREAIENDLGVVLTEDMELSSKINIDDETYTNEAIEKSNS